MTNSSAEKAYTAFKKCSATSFTKVTTTQLNVLYNILCRIKKDEKYRKVLDEFETKEGESIGSLIQKYFESYNAFHGVDIRKTLTEFADPEFAEGGYFILDTFRRTADGTLTPLPPTEFLAGETAYVTATLYAASSKQPLCVPKLSVISLSDDGISATAETDNLHRGTCDHSEKACSAV